MTDRDYRAIAWLEAKHHPHWYIGNATLRQWQEAYAAVDMAQEDTLVEARPLAVLPAGERTRVYARAMSTHEHEHEREDEPVRREDEEEEHVDDDDEHDDDELA